MSSVVPIVLDLFGIHVGVVALVCGVVETTLNADLLDGIDRDRCWVVGNSATKGQR